MSTGTPFHGVTAISEPYCKLHDIYQTYYRDSIAAYCSQTHVSFRETSKFPSQLRLLRKVRHSTRFQKLVPVGIGTRLIDTTAAMLGAVQSNPEHAVGTYLYNHDGVLIKIAIDAHDTRLVAKTDLLEWCDIY